MGEAEAGSDEESRAAAGLAYVCERLEGIGELLVPDENEGDSPELARLREFCTELGAGRGAGMEGELYGLLDALHHAIQRAGDSVGVWGAKERGIILAGGGSVPFETAFLCPIGECDGRHPRDLAGPFTCALTELPLREEQL